MFKKYSPYLLILFVCLVAYSNIFSHGLCLDDAYIFTQLPDPAQGLSGVFSVFNNLYGHADYRPVVIFSYALEQWILGGIDPGVAHTINLLLLICIGMIIYRLLCLLPTKDNKTVALLVVLLFVTHPVHSSVVSSIKNRDNLLSMLFGLLAWYHCIKGIQKNKIINSIAAALFLSIALFAKLDALSFLLIIPLSVFVFYRDSWKQATPAVAVLLLAFIARAIAALYFVPEPNSVTFTENPIVNDFSFTNRVVQTGQTFFHYIKFMIIPNGYWFYFGFDTLPIPALFSLSTLVFMLVNLIAVFGIFWFWKRDRLVSFGILFFYLSLLYCSNFPVPVAGIIADRYAFIASLGFCIALAGSILYIVNAYSTPIEQTAKRSGNKNRQITTPKQINKSYILIGIICIVNTGFTINRNKDWKNTITLLQADMPHLTNSFEANRIAASIYFKNGIEASITSGEKRAAIQQGLFYALNAQHIYNGNPYINESIGQAYFNIGQPDAAIVQLRNTLAKFDTSRISMEVLGDIYYLKNNPDSAQYFYTLTMKTFPTYAPPYFKYMRTLFKQNDRSTAKSFTADLLAQQPDWYLSYQCVSYYLLEQKDSLEGLRAYKISFDKGYENKTYAIEIRDKLLRYGDTLNAIAMEKYIK